MKKIITCIIIAILLLNVGIYVFADETSNGQQTISVELKMSQEIKNEEERKKVVVKIGYGELQGIDNGKLLAFKGIVTYDEQYFEQLTQDNVKALNGHSVTYDSKEKRLLVESTRTPKSNEEAVEITFYLKEEIKNVTTSIEFKTEEKELPKTGLQTVAIMLIVVTAVSTVSYLKYKNIEIK